jgi:hypothetical protein
MIAYKANVTSVISKLAPQAIMRNPNQHSHSPEPYIGWLNTQIDTAIEKTEITAAKNAQPLHDNKSRMNMNNIKIGLSEISPRDQENFLINWTVSQSDAMAL